MMRKGNIFHHGMSSYNDEQPTIEKLDFMKWQTWAQAKGRITDPTFKFLTGGLYFVLAASLLLLMEVGTSFITGWS